MEETKFYRLYHIRWLGLVRFVCYYYKLVPGGIKTVYVYRRWKRVSGFSLRTLAICLEKNDDFHNTLALEIFKSL